jgi:hypothetical protein
MTRDNLAWEAKNRKWRKWRKLRTLKDNVVKLSLELLSKEEKIGKNRWRRKIRRYERRIEERRRIRRIDGEEEEW